LSAIKAVGYEAISNVINEREKNGQFLSLEDFIKRVSSKDINKLQLEGLIKAGAFDCIDKNRAKLFENVPEIIKQAKNFDEIDELNQINLFETSTNQEFKINFSTINDWDQSEKIKREFESIGFFVSDHPLKNYKQTLASYNVKNYQNFIEDIDLKECMLSGTVMAIQEKKTAKGMPFAIVKFSDLSRMFEFFIFSELLVSNREKLKPGKSFLINVKRETLKTGMERTNVSRIFPIEEISEKKINDVSIKVDNVAKLSELKLNLIKEGNTSVILDYVSKNKKYIFKLNDKRKIDNESLKNLEKSDFFAKIVN